jgi:hypothetical protein
VVEYDVSTLNVNVKFHKLSNNNARGYGGALVNVGSDLSNG